MPDLGYLHVFSDIGYVALIEPAYGDDGKLARIEVKVWGSGGISDDGRVVYEQIHPVCGCLDTTNRDDATLYLSGSMEHLGVLGWRLHTPHGPLWYFDGRSSLTDFTQLLARVYDEARIAFESLA